MIVPYIPAFPSGTRKTLSTKTEDAVEVKLREST